MTTSPGRPTLFSKELADEICRRLVVIGSLRAVCRDEQMPAESTVRGWALDNTEGFFAQYTRARQIYSESYTEDIIEISDNPETDAASVNRDRLKVDTRKWLLSRVLPKVYGDKVDLNASLDLAPSNDSSDLRELARRMLFGLSLAMRQPATPASAEPTKH